MNNKLLLIGVCSPAIIFSICGFITKEYNFAVLSIFIMYSAFIILNFIVNKYGWVNKFLLKKENE